MTGRAVGSPIKASRLFSFLLASLSGSLLRIAGQVSLLLSLTVCVTFALHAGVAPASVRPPLMPWEAAADYMKKQGIKIRFPSCFVYTSRF